MGYDKLEQNLIDIIKEEQAKLGFFTEDIRLYYPLSSLNHFFDTDDTDERCRTVLIHFLLPSQINSDKLKSLTKVIGSVSTSRKKVQSMCMTILLQTNSSKALWN